jgi:uncharacterized protein YggE
MHARAARFALAVLLSLTAAAVAPAQDAKSGKRKLVVTGAATVMVKPDAARLVFTVTTTDPTAKNAREENEKQVKKLKDSLTGLAFKNVEIQVLPAPVSSAVGDDFPGAAAGPAPAPPSNKQAQSSFHVTIRDRDADKLREAVVKLADAAAEAGATGSDAGDGFTPRLVRRGRLGGFAMAAGTSGPRIDWLAENVGEARKQAIKKAVAEAHENAQAAVGDAKLEVVEMHITTSETISRVRAINDYSSGEPGPIPVTIEVQITYSY